MLSPCLTLPCLGRHQAWRKLGFPRAEAQPGPGVLRGAAFELARLP